MEDKFAIYQSKLPAELRFIGELLSPAFDISSFNPQSLLQYDPAKILFLLKQHRLYPVFYRLQLPYPQTKNNDWIRFSEVLKQLAYTNNMQMLHKASVLAKVVNAFEKNNIQVLSLKGPVLSKLLHNDFALKASIDLDVLIDKQQFDRAVAVLKELGFVQSKFHKELNKQQKNYLLNHFHHIGFFHPTERVQLELHWQLNTNKYFLDYKFEELYKRAAIVKVGDQQVKTFDSEFLILYLLVHGGHHSWYRLDWLYDFSLLLERNKHLYQSIRTECEHRKIDKLFNFSSQLSGIVFRTSFINITYENSSIEFCIFCINQVRIADFTKPVQRLKHKWYLMNLKRGFRYKSQVLLPIRTNMQDWETIKLPGRLFFLYYILRPFIFIFNSQKKSKSL